MRSAPVFQPALGSHRSFPQSQACEDGLAFAAHYPADDYAVSSAGCAARIELWTNLPVAQFITASTSRATTWKAIPLRPVHATVGRESSCSFSVRVKCEPVTADRVFGFTYRIVHPNGKIEWLGAPCNDGQIHLSPLQYPALTIPQLVQPHSGTTLELLEEPSCLFEHDASVSLGSMAAVRREHPGHISFTINASAVQSGLVIERTKSTWCTSRRFQSLAEISTEFSSNLLVLQLTRFSRKEVLVLMPVFADTDITSGLVRGSYKGDDVNFEFSGAGVLQRKVCIALGTLDSLQQTITACRLHAASWLRTCIHEPLGLDCSAKKLFDPGSPLSSSNGATVQAAVGTYHGPDCVDASLYSDSTAIETGGASLSTPGSMLLSEDQDIHVKDQEALTANGDRTIQGDTPDSPLRFKSGLGFCTWEAMQNEKRQPYLSEVVAALEAAGKRLGKNAIDALLIDDGWQDVIQGPDHRGRLNGFDMNSSMLDVSEAASFPDSGGTTCPANASVLSRYVSYTRNKFPSVRSVGCWMTLAGYWDGIHPDGSVAADLGAPLRHVSLQDPYHQASRNWFIPATELDMHHFWDKAFYFLRQCGINFVKIDAQAEWDWIQDHTFENGCNHRATAPVEALGNVAFEAMKSAATRYFGAEGCVIHSMAFTAALTNTSRTLCNQGMTIRCTDDFFPQIPEAHRHHLAHNVYNSLLLPEHYCDADMLSHCTGNYPSQRGIEDEPDYTGYHASFRAFTDAKLWISDKADAPQQASLRALVAHPTLQAQGTSIAVAAKGRLLPGAMFDDLIGGGVGPALKLIVHHENIGSATVGLWNLRGGDANTFDLLDIEELQSAKLLGSGKGRYAVTSFRTGKYILLDTERSDRQTCKGVLSATLENGSWEVLTVSPLFSTSVEGISVAMLGATDRFMAPNGIHAVSITTAYHVREVKSHSPSADTPRRRTSSLRDCFASIGQPWSTTFSHQLKQPQPDSSVSKLAETLTPAVIATSLIDIAAKVSFLIVCPRASSIETCTVDQTSYNCASTPWITLEPISIEDSSASVDQQDEFVTAFRLVVDMKAWVENLEETVRQTLSGPVSVSIRISPSSS